MSADGSEGTAAAGAGGGSERPAAAGDSLVARLERLAEDHRRLFGELVAAERRYRRLARAVWQVEEDERRRLSREVHDGLGQTLTALKHLLSRLAGAAHRGAGPDAERLDQAVEIASSALADTRELSRLLRPPMLDDLGPVAAVRWLARSLAEGTGLEVELRVMPPEAEEQRFDPELETLVFRAVQESLTNVLKHAGTRRARVDLAVAGDAVRLTVSDAGAGFDPDATLEGGADGVGLRGLRDRVALFGGRCRITSVPGRGSEVDLWVPLGEPSSGPELPS